MAKAIFNPYLTKNNKSIVYNVLQTQDGWQVEVIVPKSAPPSDRLKVLEWFGSYRQRVRNEHPHWSTVFHPYGSTRYVLEIRKANSDKELLETGESLKSICGEMLEYA